MLQMFGKKKRETSPISTLIGTGTTVTGDLGFRDGMHLEGRIVGDVTGQPGGDTVLTIGTGGEVEGAVSVDELVLNGTIRGDVTVRERVELGATAQVDGNLSYGVLEMAAGARVNGRLIHAEADGEGAGQAPPPDKGKAKPKASGAAPKTDEDAVPGGAVE